MGVMRKKASDALGYKETQDNLSVRINAHKKFSNFSLEDWLDDNLPFSKGDLILDIGCGGGNLFPSYSRKLGSEGVIVGIDKVSDLLSEAVNRKCDARKILLEHDINIKLPFVDSLFDYVISSFSIYYVEKAEYILSEIKRVLKPSGEFIVIGPTNENAHELYDFNKKIFGIDRDEKITRRTNRIEEEFSPLAKDMFNNASIQKIPSKLMFPTKDEFLKYYMATLLYEESMEKTSLKPNYDELVLSNFPTLEISKEMIVLRGEKVE